MRVSASEHGLVRVFKIDLPRDQIEAFGTPSSDSGQHWPLAQALGASQLLQDHVVVFDMADLDDLGLAGYLIQGHGISKQDIDMDRAQLARIEGHVLIVTSAAFAGLAQDLSPRAPLRWIATYCEEQQPVNFEPLPDASAKGPGMPSHPTPPINPHLTALWAVLALPILALIIGAVIYGATR